MNDTTRPLDPFTVIDRGIWYAEAHPRVGLNLQWYEDAKAVFHVIDMLPNELDEIPCEIMELVHKIAKGAYDVFPIEVLAGRSAEPEENIQGFSYEPIGWQVYDRIGRYLGTYTAHSGAESLWEHFTRKGVNPEDFRIVTREVVGNGGVKHTEERLQYVGNNPNLIGQGYPDIDQYEIIPISPEEEQRR